MREIDIPSKEVSFKHSRSSGPGGQNVNRRETKSQGFFHPKDSDYLAMTLTSTELERVFENYKKYTPRLSKDGYIIAESQKHRRQEDNDEEVMKKINWVISKSLEKKKKRILTKPSKAAKQRRLGEKKRRSEIKKARQKIKFY